MTPCPVSHKEESLLLSMWWPARDLDTLESHKSFLKGFEPKHSPSHAYTLEGLAPTATAPDAILALLRDEGFPLWTLNPPPNRMTPVIETLVCFATMVSAEGASTVAALSLHGLLPDSFPRHAWNLAVGAWFRLGGTQKTSMGHQLYRIPAGQQTMPLPQSVNASPKCLVGFTGEGKEVSVELTNTHLCLGSCTDTDVWVAIFLGTCLPYLNLRKSLSVECTGLGGADLNGPYPWDLLIRTGRHHEEVYGPSLARLERPGLYNQQNVMYVGLGLTKATHEFVMLHHFATDSAQIWDDLESMRNLTFVHAPTRRAKALLALRKSHVAPSYRRLPHPLWTGCMTMILRLCLGVMRAQLAFYMRRSDAVVQRSRPEERASAGEEPTSFNSKASSALVQDVPITPCCSLRVWGFSGGSFVGLAILQLVVEEPLVVGSGTLGALAVSPALMAKFPERHARRVRIYHFEPDKLCSWSPENGDVAQSPFQVVLVRNFDNNMDRHLGRDGHSYCHWLWLDIAPGVYKLWTAGHPVARDEAPLRLVSWLSFRLTKRCHAFIQTAMDSLCSTQNADLLEEGRGAFPEVQLTMVSQLHEVLLSEITVAGMDDPPAEVRALFESFLRQLSLPRLVHFFDLVLAQMIPRWETSAGQARSRLVCHVMRLWNDAWHRGVQRPNICFSFRRQFVSRAGIEHIAVHWQHNEVLLFTDPEHVELLDTNEFRSATALEHHRKNVQLGLRIGQAALIEFEQHGQFMKAIWILMNNKLPSQKGGSDPLNRNPFWKFVVPTVSYFAWLPAGESGTCVLRRVAGHFPDKIICGPCAVSG